MNKTKLTNKQKLQKLTTAAVLTAISLVLMATIRVPLFTPFYELEFSDFPVLICTFLLGPAYGMCSLFSVCLIQSLTVSASSGFIGFVMHFVASGAMIMIVYLIRTKVNGIKGKIFAAVLGVAAMTLIMIPMNLWLTSYFMKLPMSEFVSGYLAVCVAFNLVKASANVALFYIAYPLTSKQFKKLFKGA